MIESGKIERQQQCDRAIECQQPLEKDAPDVRAEPPAKMIKIESKASGRVRWGQWG